MRQNAVPFDQHWNSKQTANYLHLRYGSVGWIICWSARGHFFINSTVSSVQAVSHIWTPCVFRPNLYTRFVRKRLSKILQIKPTSEGIKEAKLSSLFVLTVEQRAAATTSGQGTKYHVFLSSNANTDYGLIIPRNLFSFLQSKNYFKRSFKRNELF